MHLEIVELEPEQAPLMERYLPWKNVSETDSAAKSITSPIASPILSSSRNLTKAHGEVKGQASTSKKSVLSEHDHLSATDSNEDVVDLNDCGLSTLPWRNGCSELPSVSRMCSEGTCPSFCEPEVQHHLELVRIPSKLEIVDDDGYISRATNDHLDELGPSALTVPSIDEPTADDGPEEGSLRHLRSRRHEHLSQHHKVMPASAPHSSRASRHHQATPAPRFVLEGENWSAEEETSWKQLENRVWSWLSQVEPDTPRASDCPLEASEHCQTQFPQLS